MRTQSPADLPRGRPSFASGAARIVALYAALAGLWILLSDRAVALLSSDARVAAEISTYKGWGFVLVTALVLYRLIDQLGRRIDFLAYHDALTALPNRLLAEERMKLAMAYADRSGSRAALLFLDLDNFQAINDSIGHALGDEFLNKMAERLRLSVREVDTVSRHGGDEFLILLAEIGDPQAVRDMAERVLSTLAEGVELGGRQVATSASIGIALYPDDDACPEALLQHAERAMRHAKEAGRNAYRFFDPGMVEGEPESLNQDLRRAIADGEFVLHYQPQLDLGTGAVIGAEALIRWQHPSLGMILPGRFIPLAEQTGLILPIGEWVLREACRQHAAWLAAGLPPMVVAVNLSAAQFKRGNLVEIVADALEQSGLDPACLELELTESILIRDVEEVLATVQRLKTIGVKLSIDDFGTGYSSLAYLKRFKVDKLKIDQSFVRDLATDEEDAVIVRTIIQMARSLGLTTIAEGVETQDVADRLRLLQCDEVQGYHFARPLPASDFPPFVRRQAAVEPA